ncbi:14956_t:CDS:2 [Funneliformis geosporum]|uniref:19750_t:CDS:1 n=1 Tax=Funneliformis geosporum TaxID=1117311 RepID=A0A9W4SLC8_9GLOM|nr:14956_t:CDS:2 [Funneliformis geosporum]CAI2173683.1 19750_t:CDS:2 [Funneliformis geosporum]
MKTNPNEKIPFVQLSKIISNELVDLNPKQIAHHWRNNLDPRLSKEQISDKEKSYIYSWVITNQKTRSIIQWNELQTEMVTKFGKFRSRNDLKNIWYSRKRRLERSGTKVPNNDIDNHKAKISYILN